MPVISCLLSDSVGTLLMAFEDSLTLARRITGYYLIVTGALYVVLVRVVSVRLASTTGSRMCT